MAWYDDPTIVTMILLVVIIASSSVIFAMRRNNKPKTQKIRQNEPNLTEILPYSHTPFRISKSIQTNMATNAKDELRILDLEREILSDAIRRLYEAHAEGKITEQEREKLAASYKHRMNTIKESISKDENIIALHELEGMQEDLMKLFSERFGELTGKVEELRTKIDVKPIKEIPIKLPQTEPQEEDQEAQEEEQTTTTDQEKPKKRRKPPTEKPTQKTEAERRIETIRSEVEKVLDKLGQMEIES